MSLVLIFPPVSGPCDGNLHADRIFGHDSENKNYTLDVTGQLFG